MNPQRDLARVTWGCFVLIGAIGLLWTDSDLGPIACYAIFAGGAVALVYLLLGMRENPMPPPGMMGKIWPAVFAAGSGFLFVKQFYLPARLGDFNLPLQVLYVATFCTSLGRLLMSFCPRDF